MVSVGSRVAPSSSSWSTRPTTPVAGFPPNSTATGLGARDLEAFAVAHWELVVSADPSGATSGEAFIAEDDGRQPLVPARRSART